MSNQNREFVDSREIDLDWDAEFDHWVDSIERALFQDANTELLGLGNE
jgi:hypothetical protein